ncbi:MAG: hypothetical protein DHS20C20_09320 [Ardenticatenaceae bacterium]|nr:MAG: hypothetical protein DHS20C20_09320 [Ardenticatenaceae bacterium]
MRFTRCLLPNKQCLLINDNNKDEAKKEKANNNVNESNHIICVKVDISGVYKLMRVTPMPICQKKPGNSCIDCTIRWDYIGLGMEGQKVDAYKNTKAENA